MRRMPKFRRCLKARSDLDLLLDTHVFLWWDDDNAALNSRAALAIASPKNRIFVSAVSVWEIAIKRRQGKLAFPGSPFAAVDSNGFIGVPILPIDAERAGGLDWSHTDPFDRLLVAQSLRVGLTLVTADNVIRAYAGVAVLWVG